MRFHSLLVAAVIGAGLGAVTQARAERFAGAFMAIGGGARPLGMGGAYTAVAADASTVYYNPAGVSGWDGRQALFMHSERFGDQLNFNFGAFVTPTEFFASGHEAGFGLALIHLGAPDIPVTNHIPYVDVNGDGVFTPGIDRVPTDDIRYESANDFALFGTFGAKTRYGRVGGSLKLIYSNQIAGYSATGIGLDLGYLKQDVFDGFSVGVKLQDITGTYISWSSGTNEFIAPSVKLGVAYRVDAPTLNASVLVSADSDLYFEDRRGASQLWINRYSTDLHFGAEVTLQERVMIRGGFDADNPTAGAGFRVAFVEFDYAYLQHDDFESTHRISGAVDF